MGYSDTTKGNKLYDKVNKKFLFAKNVIFLECSKSDDAVERQIDHLDRFIRGKPYIEENYEIPNLEGGRISILDHSLESTPLVPEEQTPPLAISSNSLVPASVSRLDDVVEGLGQLSLGGSCCH